MYLGCEPVKVSRNPRLGTHQVMVTGTGFPFPIELLKTSFTVSLTLFVRLLCEVCWEMILLVLRMLGERGLYLYERLETLTVCQPSLGSKVYPRPNECALVYLSSVAVGWFWSLGRYEASARYGEAKITTRMTHG